MLFECRAGVEQSRGDRFRETIKFITSVPYQPLRFVVGRGNGAVWARGLFVRRCTGPSYF